MQQKKYLILNSDDIVFADFERYTEAKHYLETKLSNLNGDYYIVETYDDEI